MNPRLILPVVLVAALCVGVWWRMAETKADGWQGYADGEFVRIGPSLQGRLTELGVKSGDMVAAGQFLFAQDAASDTAARDEVAARLAEAEARLRNLSDPSRNEEIAAAEAIARAQQTVGPNAESMPLDALLRESLRQLAR